MEDRDLIFETVSLAGEILLASGAEISRVSDTMERIARAYGNPGLDTFILSNGVLLSTGGGPRSYQGRVRHIPLGGGRLDRIDAVNQLSREIELGLHAPAEAHERLLAIRAMPSKPRWQQVLASGIGSGAFGYLFGGTGRDAAAAFLCGLVLYLYFLYLVRGRLSKIAMNISGGALVTLCALILTHLGLGSNLEMVTAGAVVPLLPGVAFTNGIRDIADEDYISGSVRLLDAVLVVACLALGVGAVMAAYTAWGV